MRTLTELQHARIEKLHDETVVVGWYNSGPLVRFPNMLVRVVTLDGRLRAVPRDVAVVGGTFA